jgi:hypothetical protein
LSLSSDVYHGERWDTEEVRNAVKAANTLGLNVGVIAVKYPDANVSCPNEIEGAKVNLWELMYRGRASLTLTEKANKKPWHEFTESRARDNR